jgi:hypothetical protein
MTKTKKSTAFWASFAALLGLFAFTAFKAPGSLDTIGSMIVVMIAAAGGIYQAANVADNWQRSKYYRSELDESAGDTGPASAPTEQPTEGK